MALYVFGDESGHSNIWKPDPNWPVFVFCATVCRVHTYKTTVVPAFEALKQRHLGSSSPILHSRDIRKGEGDFACLLENGRWKPFETDLRETISNAPFHVLASAIKVVEHREKYCNPIDPYHLSMEFVLEKVLTIVRETGEHTVRFVIESRGAKHDNRLKDIFYEFVQNGTRYKEPKRFKEAFFDISFAPKEDNIIGTQIADLMAYPIGQNIITPGYRGYLSVDPKIYHPPWIKQYGNRPEEWRYGVKYFP